MKVIFLDIDGVMNYAETDARAPSGALGIATPPLKCLSRIVRETGARIVLTSTWKKEWSSDEEACSEDGKYLNRRLNRHGLHILDKTKDEIVDRGTGIEAWLATRPFVTDWIVLDDEVFPDYDSCGVLPHLIRTSFEAGGLNDRLAQQCIERLS